MVSFQGTGTWTKFANHPTAVSFVQFALCWDFRSAADIPTYILVLGFAVDASGVQVCSSGFVPAIVQDPMLGGSDGLSS